jgi:hypothetical protein
VKFHLLAVLDAFALLLAVIGFKFGYVRVTLSITCRAGIQSGPC